MRLEGLGRLRQQKGYSMHMMADFLQISLEDYAEVLPPASAVCVPVILRM